MAGHRWPWDGSCGWGGGGLGCRWGAGQGTPAVRPCAALAVLQRELVELTLIGPASQPQPSSMPRSTDDAAARTKACARSGSGPSAPLLTPPPTPPLSSSCTSPPASSCSSALSTLFLLRTHCTHTWGGGRRTGQAEQGRPTGQPPIPPTHPASDYHNSCAQRCRVTHLDLDPHQQRPLTVQPALGRVQQVSGRAVVNPPIP